MVSAGENFRGDLTVSILSTRISDPVTGICWLGLQIQILTEAEVPTWKTAPSHGWQLTLAMDWGALFFSQDCLVVFTVRRMRSPE